MSPLRTFARSPYACVRDGTGARVSTRSREATGATENDSPHALRQETRFIRYKPATVGFHATSYTLAVRARRYHCVPMPILRAKKCSAISCASPNACKRARSDAISRGEDIQFSSYQICTCLCFVFWRKRHAEVQTPIMAYKVFVVKTFIRRLRQSDDYIAHYINAIRIIWFALYDLHFDPNK